MNIWLITVGEPLPAFEPSARPLRTGILAAMLASNGHGVTWWTSSFDHAKKIHHVSATMHKDDGGINYVLLHGCAYSRNVSFKRLLNHYQVAEEFRRVARFCERPDVILCSFPTIELAYVAVMFGKEMRIPVLLDIRDLWPDLFLDVVPRIAKPLGRALLSPYFLMTRAAMREATGIVALSEGYLRWGLEKAKRAMGAYDGIFALGYSPSVMSEADFHAASQMRALGITGEQKIVWFIGTISHQMDLPTVVRAARLLERDRRTDIQFVISGDGETLVSLREQAKGLTNIVFTGWIGAAEIRAIGSIASIGLQAYNANARMGLANKLFEYLSYGLPIVSNLRGENADFIVQHSCGEIYNANDERSLVEQLLRLLDDETLYGNYKSASQQTFRARCSLEQTYERLVRHLASVASAHASGSANQNST